MVTREVMKKEALNRMRKLNLISDCINAFKKDDTVWSSQVMGTLYELSKEQQEWIDIFEKEYGGLVYHVIITPTEFGMCFNMLYVSKHMDEWNMDNNDLDILCPCVYVKNLDDEFCSEFGSIQIRPINGGLIRIA